MVPLNSTLKNMTSNMKVLFLDHDGVICLEKQWGTRYDKQQKLKI